MVIFRRFLGEFFPAQLPGGASGKAFVDFFQVNKQTGKPKGFWRFDYKEAADGDQEREAIPDHKSAAPPV
jgi:hypothetical protein